AVLLRTPSFRRRPESSPAPAACGQAALDPGLRRGDGFTAMRRVPNAIPCLRRTASRCTAHGMTPEEKAPPNHGGRVTPDAAQWRATARCCAADPGAGAGARVPRYPVIPAQAGVTVSPQ